MVVYIYPCWITYRSIFNFALLCCCFGIGASGETNIMNMVHVIGHSAIEHTAAIIYNSIVDDGKSIIFPIGEITPLQMIKV